MDALLQLLDDPSVEVQTGAIRAVASLRLDTFVPILIQKLGQRATAGAAADALLQYGPVIESALAETLRRSANVHVPGALRAAVVRLLQHLGTPQSASILLAHLDEPDEAIRAEVYRALARLVGREPFPFNTEAIRAALAVEIRAAYGWHALRDDLGSAFALSPLSRSDPTIAPGSLLWDAVEVRLKHTLDRIFFLLRILYPGEIAASVASIRRSLEGEPGSKRAEAVELLDTLIRHEDRALLLPLIEAPVARVLEICHSQLAIPSQSPGERLAELARGADPWLRACALFQMGMLHLTELEGAVREALEADDDLVRETAILAAHSILDPSDFIAAAQAQLRRATQYTYSSAYARRLLQMEVPA
jgi:HEAT repeat protein